MINFNNGIVSLVKTPTTKNKLYVQINLNGNAIFVPHGSVVKEEWHDGKHNEKLTKVWATPKANKGNLWEVIDKIYEDQRLVVGNGSFDHFLEFTNTETKEVLFGGTTVGGGMYDYTLVSKNRAMLVAD